MMMVNNHNKIRTAEFNMSPLKYLHHGQCLFFNWSILGFSVDGKTGASEPWIPSPAAAVRSWPRGAQAILLEDEKCGVADIVGLDVNGLHSDRNVLLRTLLRQWLGPCLGLGTAAGRNHPHRSEHVTAHPSLNSPHSEPSRPALSSPTSGSIWPTVVIDAALIIYTFNQ